LSLTPSDLCTWRGKVGRAKYTGIGVCLFAIKHNLDRLVASSFGYHWGIFNYWAFHEPGGVNTLTGSRSKFYATLVAIALPFIWVGVVLTLRRLRDANLPLWMVAFFFLPFLNLFFFLVLAIIPSSSHKIPSRTLEQRLYETLAKVIPDSELGSAAMGILVTVLLAIVATMFSVQQMGNYGWGLFVGIPFFLGLNSVLVYGFHRPRPLGKCLLVALLSIVLVSIALFAIAVEGLICLIMAAPLAAVVAAFGGFIGFILQQRQSFSSESLHLFLLPLLFLPGFMALEHALSQEPPTFEVKTAVLIDTEPETVWANVIAFAELPPPKEHLFQTGIAYPIRAETAGHGVGAVRHCVFSTGQFVEPIRVWDEPHLLKFAVTSQPRVMDEWSPYRNLRPPHLENYLVSREGQFLLTRLPDGRTRLEGTTWYQNRFWPERYWSVWSDYIIHRIHERVLVHIKNLSEKRGAQGRSTAGVAANR